jgi:hypothetical protein
MILKKKNTLILFLFITAFIFAQKKSVSIVKNSVLSQGNWYKFAIDTTGVFKITSSFLQNLGINTNEINPKNIRIFGNGGQLLPMLNNVPKYDGLQENAIIVDGEEDGSFDTNDFILFYGKGPHDWNIVPFQPSLSRHQTNIYTDKAYYFLTIDNGAGKRIGNTPEITLSASQQITTFDDYVFFEEEDTNLLVNGQQWFGKELSFDNTTTVTFNFENLDSSQNVHIRVRGAAISSTPSEMNVTVNGQNLNTLNISAVSSGGNNTIFAHAKEAINSIAVSSSPIKVEITYNNKGNPSAKAFLDYVELIGIKNLIANGKQFSFRNFDTASLPATSIIEYNIENSANISQIWNVTNYINPTIISNQSTGNNFTFKSNGGLLREFIVLNDTDYFTPEILSTNQITNQNLHSLQDIDYIIITQDYLMSEAERLAAYHRENSGLTVRVVELEKIYNEFSSGSPDLTGIRDFVRHLYMNASDIDSRIKYVCLFGDASYDFKDRINSNNNIVPAFQSVESFDLARSYVTDDYYGMMDDNEGGLGSIDKQDVATGRFPVTSIQEAKATVNKTLNYYATTSFGDWRNSIAVVADDPDTAGEFVLQETVEKIADTIKTRRPIFNLTKIYADAFVQETSAGGERYPDVNEAINNAIETGTLVMDYFGHGGEDGWAGERILEVPQIQDWNNLNTLPLMITVTCEFSKFDNPLRPTAGEFVFLNTNGGATSMITTTREIFISTGQRFNEVLVKKLFGFNGEDYTIAEALMQMKNDPTTTSSQRLFVFFLGDPAMKLAQPKPNIKLTKINGVDISQSLDTLKALSKITLEGVITDLSDNILTDFNGTLSTTIFDKSVDRTTLDNNNFGRKLTFDAIESKIFRGRASVKNGVFNFNFIVPKDIRIAFGKAKVSMYADNQNIDKAGVNQDIIIGGIDENAPEDNIGPTIKLFMDDESFVDGGNTSESPNFIAVLEDESGINTSITAVDHDIVAILDGDQANPFILNDFYQTELDDFTKGKVKFPFRNLEVGSHTINFKCWDTYNNPSESTLNFVVVDDRDLVLSNVLNYPNPFINYTEFWFNHNKPNEPLEVQVQIFTVSGKLIKTINQLVQSENLSRSISWNGLDDFGNKIGKGVYVYKLSVKSIVSNTKATKFEKLVILQ